MDTHIKVEDYNNGEGILLCPKCKGENLHHTYVRAYWRFGEDGPSTESTSWGDGQTMVQRVENNPSRRRDGLRIGFICEQCHSSDEHGHLDPDMELVIYQHKGTTYTYWSRDGQRPR